jgi:tetratricopeptide (TPR) repeat protein
MYVKRYLAIKPMKADYWRLLAQLRLNEDDYGGGAGALDIAYHIDSPKRKGWEDLSDLYTYLNAPIRSARSLERAYKKEKTEKGYLKIVDSYFRALRHDKAISYIDELIKEKPTASLLLEKGKRLYDAGRFNDAITAFEECVKLESKQGEAYLIMGFAAWDLKEWDRAKTAFSYAGKTRKYRYQAEDAIAILDDLMDAQYTGDNKYKRKIK